MNRTEADQMFLDEKQKLLVENNLPLVWKVIGDNVRGVNSLRVFTAEDLYQVGCIGLCKAVYTDKFQYAYCETKELSDATARFSTYAYRLILNEILTALEYSTRRRAELVKDPVDVELYSEINGKGIEEKIADIDVQTSVGQMMSDAIKNTSGVTAKGIRAIMYSAEGYSSTEIAVMMNAKSGNNVTAWIAKARNYLKSYPELIDLLKSA